MEIKNMNLEELELLPYDEVALLILKESGNQYTTIDLFREIGSILRMSENEIQNKVTDFFTALSMNKNFILLNDGKWDLKSNHAIKVSLSNVDEDEEEPDEFEEELDEDDLEDSSLVEDEEELDDDTDDLDDLVIIDEEDLEE